MKKILTDCEDGMTLNKAKTKCISGRKSRVMKKRMSHEDDDEEEEWLEPYDPKTLMPFLHGEENEPGRNVLWKNSKNEVVDVKGDVNDAFDNLISDAKNMEKTNRVKTQFKQLSDSEGKLMVGLDEYFCVKKNTRGKAITLDPAIVRTVDPAIVRTVDPAIRRTLDPALIKKKVKPLSLL